MAIKIYIEPAGCNKRQLDLKTIRSYLDSNGYILVDRPEDADKILVGTCAFKKLEEDESVKRLRLLRKYDSDIVVYGCLPDIAVERYREFSDIPKIAPKEIEKIEQMFPGEIKRFSEIKDDNLVGVNNNKVFKSIVKVLQIEPILDREFWHRMISSGRKKLKDTISPPVTPYYLFVCRGCLGKCSYCAIRKSVGSVQSKPVATIINEFKRGVRDGYRDFTILGDDPGCYGIDIGSSLPDLLQALFAVCPEVEKTESKGHAVGRTVFRLNEIHPKFLIPYTEQLLAMERISSLISILCPIQSGNSRILQLMQREHSAEELEDVVMKIRAAQPQTIFNTQIIIGFPTETEEDFQDTLHFVAR
jgi:threonylcarbamoyladenosine tRNA methylthiotransferase CDKAL1